MNKFWLKNHSIQFVSDSQVFWRRRAK